MKACLFVGLGGFLGAVCRYLFSLLPFTKGFPMATLLTNLLGAVLIGAVAACSQAFFPLSPELLLFLKTGLCGGFTTFSTFSLESLTLFEENRFGAGGAYVLMSVGLSIAGVYAGKRLIQILFG